MPTIAAALRLNSHVKGNGAWLANLLAFQLAWFANITGHLFWGGCAAALCLAVFFATLATADAKSRNKELLWILASVSLGLLIEKFFIVASALTFAAVQLGIGGVPFWLLLIWVCFATTFRLSMNYFVRRPLWAFFAGGLACFSYAAGVALNETVHYGMNATTALIIIAAVWAGLFPLMCLAYRYWMSPR